MNRAIYSVTLLLCCGVANAAGWTSELTVTGAATEGTSDLLIFGTSDGAGYTTGCLINSWIFTASTDARRGRAYGTLLAALASGQKVRLWYTDTCAQFSYHEATSVMLVK
jgi:hypothetical protein